MFFTTPLSPPHRGGDMGRSTFLVISCCPFVNHLKDTIYIMTNIIVGKAYKMHTERLNILLPFIVIFLREITIVTISINFDGEFEFRTIKIYYILIHTVLPAKFESIYLFS